MSSLPAPGSVLKPLTKYLQQARLLQKAAPLISYYCRLYALQLGMKIPHKSQSDLQLINEQMSWLEEHQSLTAGLSKEEGRQKAEAFALQVFQHGDDEDRAGRASKQTALSFHAAYVLMDICRQFTPDGSLASDLEEKQKYAIVKAADINKAIKEGRTPKPGPLVEPEPEQDLAMGMGGLTTGGAMEDGAIGAAQMGGDSVSSSSSQWTATSSSNSSSSSNFIAPPPSYNPSAADSSSSAFGATGSSSSFLGASSPVTASSSSSSSAFPSLSSDFPSAPPAAQPPSASAPPSRFSAPAASSSSSSSTTTPSPSSASSARSSTSPSPFASALANRTSGARSSGSALKNRDPAKLDAVRESERLIKHALSAVVFSDIDTTVDKLKQALHLLQPYSNK